MTGTIPSATRRQFLKQCAAAAGALGFTSLISACAAPTPSPGAPAATSKPGAPTAAAAQAAVKGGTLTFGSSADVVSLDPANISDTISQNVFQMLHTPLIMQTPDLDLVPGLATSWTGQDNVWTVKLRQGVKFHDGTPFNAAAVDAHVQRILGPEKPLLASQWVPYVDSFKVVDDYTVQFTTKAIDAFFPNRLTGGVGSIESPAAFQKYGKDLARNPVGTGPFKFGEWVTGDHITVTRNDDFWGGPPNLDKVIVRAMPDAEARAIALEAGDIQLSIAVTPEQVGRLSGNPSLALDTVASTRTLFIGMSSLKSPFSDLKVRQALNYAIDKQAIVKSLYQDLAEVLGGMVPKGSAGYAAMPGFPYDPAKAKDLLAQAGYANGFSATLVGPKGRYLNDFELEQAIQQQLKAVGVDIQLQVVEYAEYLNQLRADPSNSPLQMWLDAWSGNNVSDIIQMRYGCNSFRPKGANTAGFCDAQVDSLSIEGLHTLDEAARNKLLLQAQQMLSEAAASIWLMSLKNVTGRSKKLHNPVESRGDVLTVDASTWMEA